MRTPTSTIHQTGDLGGRKIMMSVDENSLAHIMSIMTDLYSDPIAAIIREYSTNARDADVESGYTGPIEVALPNAFSPYFKVQDHGPGLSVDDIEDMYSKYGASSKRDSDTQVGMLGLGAKSALSYTAQFSLVSIKNGVKITVSISRSANGAGQMEIIDTKATDEPNGVLISIPMQRNSAVQDKAYHFFRFWEPGTVLINGVQPSHIEGEKVGKRFIVNKKLRQDYVVMGGVPYPVTDPGLHKSASYFYEPYGIVAFVEIGDVHFTPSREALHYTAHTKATLDSLRAEFIQHLHDSARAEVKAAKSYTEAWQTANKWASDFSLKDFKYKGHDVPVGTIATRRGKSWTVNPGRSYSSWSTVLAPTTDDVIAVNFTGTDLKMSPAQRTRARIYANQQGITIDRCIVYASDDFLEDKKNKKWLDGLHIVDWSVIAAVKLPKQASTSTFTGIARTDPYDMYDDNGRIVQVSSFDTNKPIVYFSPAEGKDKQWIYKVVKDAQVVLLPRNRWDKFKRDWPTAQHYAKAIQKVIDGISSKFTVEDEIYYHYKNYGYQYAGLAWTEIDDPDVATFVRVISDKNYVVSENIKTLMALKNNRYYVHEPSRPANPLTKYPLVASISRSDHKHTIWYLNSYFAELQKV